MIQIHCFSLPIPDGRDQEDELNLFLRSHQIVDIQREMVILGDRAYWSFCIQYHLDGTSPISGLENRGKNKKVDYKEVLSEDQFQLFQHFRVVRKELAQREALPAYAIFTDEELANIVRLEQRTVALISGISGIGQHRANKYATYFCES